MPRGTPLPSPPTNLTLGWLSSAAKKAASPVIYVSSYNHGIQIFPEHGKLQSPIGMISFGAYGLYLDRHHNLYAANRGLAIVNVYREGSTAPSLTYREGLIDPLYPIVDKHGNLFVGNGDERGPSGTVVEYLSGSTKPYRILQTPGDEVDGMDFDLQGNLYVAYRTFGIYTNPGSIEEFPPNSSQGRILGMTINAPQGLVVDKKGNIVVVETDYSTGIYLFPAGQTSPSLEVPMPYNDTPAQLAIREKENKLFVTGLDAFYVTDYPFDTKTMFSVKDEPEGFLSGGIALSNGQTF